MKISSSTPFFHCWVPWSTRRESSSAPPSTQSDTVTVMIPASVMSRFRRNDTRVSRAKYPMRVSTTGSAPDAVDAARLVPDQGAAIELDDPAAHHVDDPRVVGRHDDG